MLYGVPKDWYQGMPNADTVVASKLFDSSLPHLEYEFYEHIAVHKFIEVAVNAEEDGFDAILMGCFYDPGVREVRELVKIPVVGVGEASFHMAAMLSADKFSVLVGRRKWIPKMSANARVCGLDSRIASWRVLDLSVPDMKDDDKTYAAVLREAEAAVREDHAEVVCLGCTGLIGQAQKVQEKLGVPVLDPIAVGLKMAEFKASLWKQFSLSHSKIGGYEAPPPEEFRQLYKSTYSKLGKLLR